MKIIGYAIGALIVIGLFKGAGSIDFGEGKNAVIEIAGSLLSGVRDMTVYLIPTIVEQAKNLIDQIPSANGA
ncbi:MAG: hypothetical protein L0H59_10950 [Tomitella sp.]|nr:hypothetical protein [Tomitella sp.]